MNPSLTDSRRQALRSASHWYAVLSGERVSPQQEARWQQWYEQDQDNQWAWQQVENLRNQLGGVPGDVASRALHDTRLTRRHVMKGLLLLLGAGGGWQLWQSETGEGLRADYRTAKGAVSRQQLEDGSLLTLNTPAGDVQCGPFKEAGLIEQQADDDDRNKCRCRVPDDIPDNGNIRDMDDTGSQRQHSPDTRAPANTQASGLPDHQYQRQ